MVKNIYNEKFYSYQSEPSYRSAQKVVPILIELINPQSVIDVGCGIGTWLKVFNENSIEDVLGIDGNDINPQKLLISEKKFRNIDLCSNGFQVIRKFDLCICLEVLEHIPERYSNNVINFLTTVSPVVYFSAAVPGQGGANHINEQWQEYWCRKFSERGYITIDAIRPCIWEIANVEPWYSQNSFLFIHKYKIEKYNKMRNINNNSPKIPYNIIHPVLFQRFVDLEYVSTRKLFKKIIERIQKKINLISFLGK